MLRCEPLPGNVLTTAYSQPALAASHSRRLISAVCTPRRRNSGSVAVPNKAAMPASRMMAPSRSPGGHLHPLAPESRELSGSVAKAAKRFSGSGPNSANPLAITRSQSCSVASVTRSIVIPAAGSISSSSCEPANQHGVELGDSIASRGKQLPAATDPPGAR